VTGRRVRRRRKLLDGLKERRGYCHLKEEALDRTMWRARFGPVVRVLNELMNVLPSLRHLLSPKTKWQCPQCGVSLRILLS
jgi:hypothetical protein